MHSPKTDSRNNNTVMSSCVFVKVNKDGRQLHGLQLVEVDMRPAAPPWISTSSTGDTSFYGQWTYEQLLGSVDADIRLADFDAEARVFPTRKFLLEDCVDVHLHHKVISTASNYPYIVFT